MSSNFPTISRTSSNHSAISVSPSGEEPPSTTSPVSGSSPMSATSSSGISANHTRLNRSATQVKSPAHNPHHSKRTFSMSDTLNLAKLPSNMHLHENGQGGMSSPMTSSLAANFHQLSDGSWSNRVEDFEIRKPIGYGSSAVVYSAIYKPFNKRIAIKIIDLDLFERNQIDELRRETALMALSKHPNVLRVYGSFVNGSKLYIVTPYLSGGSCLDIMKTAFPEGFDEVSIATVLKQALEGLIYLHKNGHIHRDVKAGNLLMDDDGSVLLADFGVSSSLVENGESGLRKTFVGTPCWMAPEVMEQAGYDYKADIWSFGITAIELATGHAPFAKFPPMKVLMMTLSNDPPTLIREHAKRKYSKQFKEMIDLCLNKDPAKRPSAEKLLQHSFFKQAKKKDYLVKTLLASLPPLDQRPHRKVPQKHHSISRTTQWDFDGEENETEESATSEETEKANPPTSSVTFAVDQSHPSQSSTPASAGGGKKHISFGDAVVKSPSPAPSPSSHHVTTISTQNPELVIPTAIAPRKSRFVIEDSNSEYNPASPFGIQMSQSPSSASPDPKEPSGMYSAGSSASSSHQMLVGLGMTSGSSASPNTAASNAPTQPSETEVKKGRFSVNQTHRAGTPTNDVNSDTDRTISRSGSQDNLAEPKDRKSRFEIQHNQQQQQQQQPPAGTSPQQVRFETIPLSRENSTSQHSIHRDSPSGKISRFSVEPTREIGRATSRDNSKDREGHTSDTASSTASVPLECRKKGRFELTGGSSTPLSSTSLPHTERPDKIDTQYHESAHSSVSVSPSTSPSSSLSRGQAPRLTEQASAHILTSHLEALLKQNETQRMILTDLYGGMGGGPSNPNISRSRAGSESRRAPFPIMEPMEPKPLSSSTDVLFGMDQLQQKMQAILRDNESLHRENDNLRRELDRLRRSANATVINTASGPSTMSLSVPSSTTKPSDHTDATHSE
ncbi:hypothetical protein K450DRAFT_245242 [Umbelopsis ramanniana AG]|uniref:Protein kinase domain-containing protein n=1 Tax=Umbelopsis ramanniana AG TaxID=1314678 RepID=A0AAD5HDP2_UMBRA|nr:uncharacterized protein K450DRAFT_245242 [Umbelopsis ramanniana AG]KAI8578731.1 hypothetical protein K450DRAFT_245242 [Umbelopsis ramanniana AG]